MRWELPGGATGGRQSEELAEPAATPEPEPRSHCSAAVMLPRPHSSTTTGGSSSNAVAQVRRAQAKQSGRAGAAAAVGGKQHPKDKRKGTLQGWQRGEQAGQHLRRWWRAWRARRGTTPQR